MAEAVNTDKHQRLEIMIKISHQFLKALIKYGEEKKLEGLTKHQITDRRIIRFDMMLIEKNTLERDDIAEIMQDGVEGIAGILVGIMGDMGLDIMPLKVLKDFEKRWDWKEIFKGAIDRVKYVRGDS
jgi:hypothetical protein